MVSFPTPEHLRAEFKFTGKRKLPLKVKLHQYSIDHCEEEVVQELQ